MEDIESKKRKKRIIGECMHRLCWPCRRLLSHVFSSVSAPLVGRGEKFCCGFLHDIFDVAEQLSPY